MSNLIDPFELPYPNWYDAEGRIYKDVLIKNFNAIEEKINEIAAIDISSIATPDISSVVYPDVTLTSTDSDEQILNLRSFLDICDLINFPLVVKTNGNLRVTRVEYWGSDYAYHTITTGCTPDESNPFVYLNYDNNTLIKSNAAQAPEDCELVAVLVEGKLILNKFTLPGNINFPSVLAAQQYNTQSFSGSGASGTWVSGGDKRGGADYKDQTVFMFQGETGGAGTYSVNTTDFGLTGKLKGDS